MPFSIHLPLTDYSRTIHRIKQYRHLRIAQFTAPPSEIYCKRTPHAGYCKLCGSCPVCRSYCHFYGLWNSHSLVHSWIYRTSSAGIVICQRWEWIIIVVWGLMYPKLHWLQTRSKYLQCSQACKTKAGICFDRHVALGRSHANGSLRYTGQAWYQYWMVLAMVRFCRSHFAVLR